MKRITSIGLILLLSLQCFYQLGVITYFELNRDFIAKVLCINREKPATTCQGQCFLKRNLDVAEDKTSEDGTVPPGSHKVDLPVFLITLISFSFQGVAHSDGNDSRYLQDSSSTHLSRHFRPPAVVS